MFRFCFGLLLLRCWYVQYISSWAYAARLAGNRACLRWLWHSPYDGLFAHGVGFGRQNFSHYAYLYGYGRGNVPCGMACKTEDETDPKDAVK